jgi:hypothetical protein
LNAIDAFSKARDLVEERTTILLADFDAETRFEMEQYCYIEPSAKLAVKPTI